MFLLFAVLVFGVPVNNEVLVVVDVVAVSAVVIVASVAAVLVLFVPGLDPAAEVVKFGQRAPSHVGQLT